MSAAPFVSIPEREAQVAKLADFFSGLPDGEEVSWLRIEADTGIKMDWKGRGLARRALGKLKRPYAALRGEGLRLSSPENATEIMNGRFIRIDGAVKRADKTREHIVHRHFEKMPAQEQQRMLVLAGFFGAVRAFAKEASVKLLRK